MRLASIFAALCFAACAGSSGPSRTGSPKEAGACGGSRVNLEAALANRGCEHCSRASDRDLTGLIESRLELSASRIKAGGEIDLRAVIRNISKRPVVLLFVWHFGPMFSLRTMDAEGQDAAGPHGPPPLEPGESYRPGPPYLVCVTLEPGGEAYVERTWRAVRWRWAEKQVSRDGSPTPRTPVPPQEVAGPLPPGRYQLSLQTMLQVIDLPDLGAPSAWVEVVP